MTSPYDLVAQEHAAHIELYPHGCGPTPERSCLTCRWRLNLIKTRRLVDQVELELALRRHQEERTRELIAKIERWTA